jgi:uncharacterized protein (TIGR03437 family)
MGLAPGSLVTLFGDGFTDSSERSLNVPLPVSLAGVQVLVNGIPAHLTFAGPSQINFQVPWGALAEGESSGTATITVVQDGVPGPGQVAPLTRFAPGIFTLHSGVGPAIVADGNGSAMQSAQAGGWITLYASGLGPVDAPPADGANSLDQIRQTATKPVLLIGNQPAEVMFAGLSPQLPGVYQINAVVPQVVMPGDAVPIQLQVDGITTTSLTTIAISSPDAATSAPTISAVTIGAVTGSGAYPLSVTGTNFRDGLSAALIPPGGLPVTYRDGQVQAISSTSAIVTVLLGLSGNYGLQVTNPGGEFSNVFRFPFLAPPPSIQSIAPAIPHPAAGLQTLTVRGGGFLPGMVVFIGLPGGGFTQLSGFQVRNLTAAGADLSVSLPIAGVYSIQLLNPDAQRSELFLFTVGAGSTPVVNGINPVVLRASPNFQTLTVTGSGFQAGLTIRVVGPNGLLIPSAVNVTALSFQTTLVFAAAGNYTIQIFNPDTQVSNQFHFLVAAGAAIAPAPVITGSSPPVTASPAEQTLTVIGANFQTGLTVQVTGPIGFVPKTVPNVLAAAGSFQVSLALPVAGSYFLHVTNPDHQISNQFGFIVTRTSLVGPSISGVTPPSPAAGATLLGVTGANFLAGLTVVLSGPQGPLPIGPNQIQDVTVFSFRIDRPPLSVAGPYSLQVINPGAAASNVFLFIVH